MPQNEKNKQYIARYKAEKIKRVPLDMQITAYNALLAHVTERGETVNGYIKRAIAETMERDKATPDTPDTANQQGTDT